MTSETMNLITKGYVDEAAQRMYADLADRAGRIVADQLSRRVAYDRITYLPAECIERAQHAARVAWRAACELAGKPMPKARCAEHCGECFACGRKLGRNPHIADTGEDQYVKVGSECYRLIAAAGAQGWQPSRGGPRLFAMTTERACYFGLSVSRKQAIEAQAVDLDEE